MNTLAPQTNRELLALAALAVDVDVVRWNNGLEPYSSGLGFILDSGRLWNPQTNDGDSARMEATLGINVEWSALGVVCGKRGFETTELFVNHAGDKQAARRMASLRIAAEIGKAIP